MVVTATEAPGAQALIMAGGRGERLYPLTVSRPKPAVPFGGVFRIIDFPLSNCLNSGVSRVSLLTQYRHEELQGYVRNAWGKRWNTMEKHPLVCLPPVGGKRYRGTADAVYQNIAALQADNLKCVLILSGDHVYHMDYRALLRSHAETDADLTIATVEHPLKDAAHFGVVEVDTRRKVIGFQEKPPVPRPMPERPASALISMGVYAFKREVLIQALMDSCDRDSGYDFGHHIIPSLIRNVRVYAYDFRDPAKDLPHYWRDIGTVDSYYNASMDLVGPKASFNPYTNDGWPSLPVHDSTRDGRSHLPPRYRTHLHTDNCVLRSVLSPGVCIEEGGSVERSVLMSDVWIGKGARIRHAIVEEGVHIPAGFRIGFDSESDRKHYVVTDAGVVVVTETPKSAQPVVRYFSRAVVSNAPMEFRTRRQGFRRVA